jgi:hypothetical protein
MAFLNPNLYFVKLNIQCIPKNLVILSRADVNKNFKKTQKRIYVNMIDEKVETNLKLSNEKEKTFFEGPPSKSELIIPFISILTVIGIIPFISTLFRQFWVSYKITNRRISVKSGFQGNNKVEIVYRDIKKISYITRFGGLTADLVILLKDNARLEIRSLPDWEKNLEFIKSNCPDYVNWN